jgi:hypothetical protein
MMTILRASIHCKAPLKTTIPSARFRVRLIVGTSLIIRNGEFKVQEVRSLVSLIERQSITDDPGERVGVAASDHAPVLVRFNL